jgi:hypothetical protein
LKLVAHDASRPNQEYNLKPLPNFIDNESEFEVEVILKSRQLRGLDREYLVKWKRYYPTYASWVNELEMEHAQEAIK